jgi:hypothetical protein
MMINLNRFELETPSIPRNFGLGSASCVVSFEPMSVLYLALGLIAVYAAIVTAMYVGQTWLLFPTALARIARVQLLSSTQHLEVRTPDGESLKGIRTPSREEVAQNASTLLGFGGNAWNPSFLQATSTTYLRARTKNSTRQRTGLSRELGAGRTRSRRARSCSGRSCRPPTLKSFVSESAERIA